MDESFVDGMIALTGGLLKTKHYHIYDILPCFDLEGTKED